MRQLLILAFASVTTALLANGGGYIRGVKSLGAFQPKGIEQVEMQKERLEIDLHIEYADVRIEYVLHNPGKKTTIQAGFPSAIGVEIQGDDPDKPKYKKPTLENFSLKTDGKDLKVQHQSDDLKLVENGMVEGAIVTSWHSFSLDFAADETKRLTVSYRNPYFGEYDYVSEDERISALSFTYLFSSAGLWKGPIAEGTVIIRAHTIPAAQVRLSHPKRFIQTAPAEWTWNFKDFEPTLEDDLTIITRPAYFAQGIIGPVPGKPEELRVTGNYVAYGISSLGDKLQATSWEFHRSDYQIIATSNLVESGDTTYVPSNLQDHDTEAAWVEGVKGDGIDESLTLTLSEPAKVTRIGIVNGYAKDKALYEKNGRVAEFSVKIDDGNPFTVTIPDEFLQEEQFFFDLPAKAEPTKTIKLTIQKVYPGSKYQDTAISEITLVTPLEKAPKIQAAR